MESIPLLLRLPPRKEEMAGVRGEGGRKAIMYCSETTLYLHNVTVHIKRSWSL